MVSKPEDLRRTLTVRVRAEHPSGQAWVQPISDSVAGLAGFRLTQDQAATVDMELRVVGSSGGKGDNPRCLVLTPDGRLWQGQDSLKISLARGTDLLRENLGKLSTAWGLVALEPAGEQENQVSLSIDIFRPGTRADLKNAQSPRDLCLSNGKMWMRLDTLSLSRVGEMDRIPGSKMLGFNLGNNSGRPLYFSILDVTPDGQIIQVYPSPLTAEAGRLAPFSQRTVDEVTLIVDKPGGYLRVLVSPEPLDLTSWVQAGYVTHPSPADRRAGGPRESQPRNS
jgi:hypothetical protein